MRILRSSSPPGPSSPTDGRSHTESAGDRDGPVVQSGAMAAITWGEDVAAAYDRTSARMFEPAVLDPVVDRLVELAAGGAALELAIGTGRVAVPVHGRGVPVTGIELSP